MRDRAWPKIRWGRVLLALFGVTGAGVGVCGLANLWVAESTDGLIFRAAADVPARYALIVPGAAVHGDRLSNVLEDRIMTAAAAYRGGRAARILVSGDHGTAEYDEVRAMRLRLLAEGVPNDAIFLDHAGFRTLDSMRRAAAVFGVRSAIVVTQEFHLARSIYLARAAGIDAVGLVADRRRYAYAGHYARREFLARAKAALDIEILGTGPKFFGPAIPIEGDARLTHDPGTQ